jgi:hypothetical protein
VQSLKPLSPAAMIPSETENKGLQPATKPEGAYAINNTDKKIPEEFNNRDLSSDKSISERIVDFFNATVRNFTGAFFGSNNNEPKEHAENTQQEIIVDNDVQQVTDIEPIEVNLSKTQKRKNRRKAKTAQPQLVTKEDTDDWQTVPSRNKQSTPKIHETDTLTEIPFNSSGRSYRKKLIKEELDEIKKQTTLGNINQELLLQTIEFYTDNPSYKTESVLMIILDLCRLLPDSNKETTEHYIKKMYQHLADKKYNSDVPKSVLMAAFHSLLNASKNISYSETEKMYHKLKENLEKIPYWEAKFGEEIKKLNALASEASKMAKTDLEQAMYIYLDLLESRYKPIKVATFLLKNVKPIFFSSRSTSIFNNIENKLLKLITKFNKEQDFFLAGVATYVRSEILMINKNLKLAFNILLEQKQQETDVKIEEKDIMKKPATYIGVDISIVRTVKAYDIKYANELLTILLENHYGKNFPKGQFTKNYFLNNLMIEVYIELKDLDVIKKLCENIDKLSFEEMKLYKKKKIQLVLALNKTQEALKLAYQLHKESYEKHNQNSVGYNSNEPCGDISVDLTLADCLKFDHGKVQTVVDFLEKIEKNYDSYDAKIHSIYCYIDKPNLAIRSLHRIKRTAIENPVDNFKLDEYLLVINQNYYGNNHSEIVKLLFNLIEKYKDYPPADSTRVKVYGYYASYLITKKNYSEVITILKDNLPYARKQRRFYINVYLNMLVKVEDWDGLDKLWQTEGEHHNEHGTLCPNYIIGKINQYIQKIYYLKDQNITHKVKELNDLSTLILTTIDNGIAKNNDDALAVLYFLKYEMFLLLGHSKEECDQYYDQAYALLNISKKDKIMAKVKFMEEEIRKVRYNFYNQKTKIS